MDKSMDTQAPQQKAAALMAEKKYQAACKLLHDQLKVTPNNGSVCETLGEAYLLQQHYADAAKHFYMAKQLMPTNPNPNFQLGNIYVKLGRFEESCQFYVNALRISPNAVQVYEALAKTLVKLQAYEEAIKAYQRAIKIAPTLASLQLGLATLLIECGELEQGLVHYRMALQSKPHPIEHSAFLFAMNYRPDISASMVSDWHRDWGQLHTAHLPKYAHSNSLPAAARKVRIGLVSSDFYRHPVTYYLEPFLEHYDRSRFEIFCYSHVVKQDEVTERLKTQADHWRTISTTNIAGAVATIRQDEVDVLVDLSGQTACKLLLIFGHKPASIQVSWLGYFNTSGLESMDYLITDPHSSPAGQSVYFTEQLLYMPYNRFCYRPPEYAPEVNALPALQTGYITFGCFNNYLKLNNKVIALWATLLNAFPGSKLLLKNKAMNDAFLRKQTLANFEKYGISADRLLLEKTSPHPELLAAYSRVDIALDPFPFTGGLTTSEALWMGVPVVTLAGETLVSRQGAAFLTVINKTEWIATRKTEYVSIACALAGDLSALAGHRQSLRAQIQGSPLCDGKQFARDLQALFSGIIS
ncbi:O-linked N-acetylglucosamine transferase, SPINDLY family protein [Methylophilus aquaticus]|uniref:protein O-GlcNAc transferase n=1 Tax=Methylophilus aquaticus TaxID=1971610 RepID=A0ABT9JP92_9PROT|nr:tetratricopeptide repeat protein [Methylophilus aquaticus]MDP8566383.1 tetratricopeptide repeat protein [Methylophilus aquaticus]